jgi:homocysteine S-methyltransferase
MARVRMGAMSVGFAIQRDVGLESLIHFTTRDRNLMALESELLGAHALGIRDILALTGDPPRVGDYPSGTGIWDIDSIGLIGILQRLNRGEDQAGRPIGAPAGFTIACALDPTAEDLDAEIGRLAGKVEAGAHLIMTQPIYATEQWDRFMERASARWGDRLPLPVLFGVLPLHTARHAEFLHHEVPGITIPDDVREAMHQAGDRGAEVGLEQSLTLLAKMRPHVDGTYIMPSFGRYEQSAELVRRVRSELLEVGT